MVFIYLFKITQGLWTPMMISKVPKFRVSMSLQLITVTIPLQCDTSRYEILLKEQLSQHNVIRWCITKFITVPNDLISGIQSPQAVIEAIVGVKSIQTSTKTACSA